MELDDSEKVDGKIESSDEPEAENAPKKGNKLIYIVKIRFDLKFSNLILVIDVSQDEKDGKLKKPGVIYLSTIPTKMNVKIIREYFANFGSVGRIYLEPRGKLYI